MKNGRFALVFFSLFVLLLIDFFLKGQQQHQRQRRPRVPWEERSP